MALSVASFSTTAAANTTSVVITKPTGLVVGDIMFAFIMNENGVTAAPSGWTLIGSIDRTNYYYVVATSTQTAASNFTWTVNSGAVGGVITRSSAPFNTTSPYQVSATTVNITSNPSFAIGLTPATADSLLLFYAGYRYSAGSIQTVSAQAIATSNPTWTEIYDSSVVSGQTFGGSLAWATRNAVTATGNATATYTISCDVTMGVLIIIRPAYSLNINETVTLSEIIIKKFGVFIRDVNILVELVNSIKNRLWANQSKNSSTWTNQTKN